MRPYSHADRRGRRRVAAERVSAVLLSGLALAAHSKTSSANTEPPAPAPTETATPAARVLESTTTVASLNEPAETSQPAPVSTAGSETTGSETTSPDSTLPDSTDGSGPTEPSVVTSDVAGTSEPSAASEPAVVESTIPETTVMDCVEPSYAANTSRPAGWGGGGIVDSSDGRTPSVDALDEVGLLLASLREVETSGDYQATAVGASGAYLLSDADWAGHGGYAVAAAAPPEVQDARARELVEQLLHGGLDSNEIAALWFHSNVVNIGASGDVDDFVSDVASQSASHVDPQAAGEAASAPVGGGIVFPVAGPVTFDETFGAPRDAGARCHEGTDIFGVPMQPILAPVSGVVAFVTDDGLPGTGLSISAGGVRYNLFHLARLAPGVGSGSTVHAGQVVGYMGDSGNAEGGPVHLHFEIRDGSGNALPSFDVLESASRAGTCRVVIGPDSAYVTGRSEADTSHVVVATATGHGRWTIDTAGRITATGDAALITPTSGCELSDVVYGTDAGG